jgi:hypothetical protein
MIQDQSEGRGQCIAQRDDPYRPVAARVEHPCSILARKDEHARIGRPWKIACLGPHDREVAMRLDDLRQQRELVRVVSWNRPP